VASAGSGEDGPPDPEEPDQAAPPSPVSPPGRQEVQREACADPATAPVTVTQRTAPAVLGLPPRAFLAGGDAAALLEAALCRLQGVGPSGSEPARK
jgi:hypothetical protein